MKLVVAVVPMFPLLLLLQLLLFAASSSSQKIVRTLPGFSGALPFKLETGYVSVGEKEDTHLFYYFVESQGNPRVDPLLLWHSGGPGCSSLFALLYEFGPLAFDLESLYASSKISLITSDKAWTEFASIIFIDYPPGTGFAYSSGAKVRNTSDTMMMKQNYEFIRKWMLNHPKFLGNPLYIAGDSYGGRIAALLAYEIAKGVEQGHYPPLALQGYISGNGINAAGKELNERIPYAHGMGLLSYEHYEHAKTACNGDYINTEYSNSECIQAVANIHELLDEINMVHILEPKCPSTASIKKLGENARWSTFLDDDDTSLNFISMPGEKTWCREVNYVPMNAWANDPTVQEALGVRKGTLSRWAGCQRSIENSLIEDVHPNNIHRYLSDQGYKALAYSGDHDLEMPFRSTLLWIRQLNLSLSEKWRPWMVNNQIAGYTMSYKNDEAVLTFATVKGAGHTAPEHKPEECYAMLERWLSKSPL